MQWSTGKLLFFHVDARVAFGFFFFFLIRLLSFAWLNSRGMVLDIPFLYILCALYRYGIYSLFYTAFLIENEVVFI